jgi:hypothetical protein
MSAFSVISVFSELLANRSDYIALRNPAQGPDITDYPPEHGICTVEVRLGRQSDEPLARARVGAGQCHPHHRLIGVSQSIDFVTNGPARPTIAIAAGIPILHHERRHYAMPAIPIKKPAIDQAQKIGDRQGSLWARELNIEHSPLLCVDQYMRPGN